jgi:outer membrane receptor protein involved in Fe transport
MQPIVQTRASRLPIFFLGALNNSNLASFIKDRFQQFGYVLYAQDDFKISKRLMLNLGLRYEFISMPMERRDAEGSYNIATGALDIPKGRNDPLPPNFFPEIAINRSAPGSWYRRIAITLDRGSGSPFRSRRRP